MKYVSLLILNKTQEYFKPYQISAGKALSNFSFVSADIFFFFLIQRDKTGSISASFEKQTYVWNIDPLAIDLPAVVLVLMIKWLHD